VKSRSSPAVVGMFVLGALLLTLLGFISFGGSNFFSKPTRFVVYFDESVSGLDPGAAVKINGVRIGRVAAIAVRYDTAARSAQVQTICEVDRNVLMDGDGHTIEITNPAELQSLVERGLRARLTLQGITGLLFVELSFVDPLEYPDHQPKRAEAYPVVPAIPSPISELQNSLVDIVADIKAAKISELSRDLRALLNTANQKLVELDVQGLSARLSGAAEAVEAFVNAPEARSAFQNLNTAIADLRALIAKVDGEVGPVGAEFKKTLADAQKALQAIDGAAVTTKRFVNAQGDLSQDVARTLQQVADAAEAIQRLAELLERNPNALIVGRKPAETSK